MRPAEFRFLFFGLPLLVSRKVEKDIFGNPLAEPLLPGTSVTLFDQLDDQEFEVRYQDQTCVLHRNDLDVNYQYVDFPNFDLCLKPISLQSEVFFGMKFVTGDENREYDGIGVGQVVEVSSISPELQYKDRFGTVRTAYSSIAYEYDESKLGQSSDFVLNPTKVLPSFSVNSDNISVFSKTVYDKLGCEINGNPSFGIQELSFAIANAIRIMNKGS